MAITFNHNDKLYVNGSNVGIGTNSPLAKLHVEDSAPYLIVKGTGSGEFGLKITDSSNSTGGLTYSSVTGEQRLVGAQSYVFQTFYSGGSERMRITADGTLIVNGTVPGYNTAQGYPLHVKGTASQGYISISRGTQSSGVEGLIVGTDASNAYLFSRDNIPLVLGTNNSSKVFIQPNGNVGIGTPSPNGKLQVDGDIYVNGADRKIMNYNGAVDYGTLTNNSVRFNTAGTEKVRISGEGNVGIGLTDPDSRLDVNHGAPGITAGPTVRISKGGSPVGLIRYDTLVIEADDVPTIRMGENDGTVSTIMSGDSNLRINSTHPIKFYTAGTTTGEAHAGQGGTFAMIIDNSQNVGIGNTAPTARLSVTGVTSTTEPTMKIQSGTSNVYGMMTTYDAYHGFIMRGIPAAATTYGVNAGDQMSFFEYGGQFRFYKKNITELTEIGRIDSTSSWFNSNVGIGTTSPLGKLDVFQDGIYYTHDNAASRNWLTAANYLSYGDFAVVQSDAQGTNPYPPANSTTRLYISTAGNVGIGTTSPSYKLDVSGSSRIAGGSSNLALFVNTTSTFGAAISYEDTNTGGNDVVHAGAIGQSFYIAAGYSEHFRVAETGRVGIGTTSPSYKLDVSGAIRATGDITANSDARLKENVETVSNALDKVTAMRGVTFNKIGEEKRSVGVIAQELLEVLPEAVDQDNEGIYNVAYGNITGVLIEAIKELTAEVNSLKEQLKNK